VLLLSEIRIRFSFVRADEDEFNGLKFINISSHCDAELRLLMRKPKVLETLPEKVQRWHYIVRESDEWLMKLPKRILTLS
jgi:hypothetical protein